METIKRTKAESRKEYLYRVALRYLKNIQASEYEDALSTIITYDEADCDGACLIDDMENAE